MSNKEIVLDIQNLTVQFHIDNEVIEAVNDVSLAGKGQDPGPGW